MNPTRISILSIVITGAIFTFLLVNLQQNHPASPLHDTNAAQSNAGYLGQQLNDNLDALNESLKSLSYNSFWQSSPVADWPYWLDSQKQLYQTAGISLLGVHAKANDVVYFDKPSLPGQYTELKKPLSRLYQTKDKVNLLQIFRNEPAIIILMPLKNVENQLIGALIGVKYLNTALLKKYHHSVKVPVAVVNNDKIQTVSVETSPALEDYQLIEVTWPQSIKSALWQLVLLVEPTPAISMTLGYLIVGAVLTLVLLFIVLKQVASSRKANRLLADTIDIQLPISEQINRLTTLQNLSNDPELVEIIQAIRIRLEQMLQQKKSLSLEIRKLQDSEKNLKRSVSALTSERDNAFAAPKLKSEFLSRMGDEITTPMKSVVSMLKLLSEYQFEPEPKQLLNIAKRSTRTLVDNLNNILDFSKLDAGMLKLKNKSFSVRELVDELSSELSHFANDKGLSLQASTAPEVPPEVNADLFRIKQILRNLLGNAIRFTKEGEVTLYADLMDKDGGQMLRFTIKDTGVGIPSDAQQGLFGSLEQTTKLTNSSFAGRLRLIVSRHLAELMGGEIDVISEVGRGSQFWFTVDMKEK